jgi:uncharacterized membrane protein YccC
MSSPKFLSVFHSATPNPATRSDLGRALRGTLAVMVPLVAAAKGWLPFSLPFFVFAAQSVSIVDVRGAYSLRMGLLVVMTLILAGAAGLGQLHPDDLMVAILAGGFVAACGGLWRQLLPDYGASLAVSSTLLFLVSVALPSTPADPRMHGLSALAGGLWGVLLQVANWPINPQHPLRRVVSDSWATVGDFFDTLSATLTAPLLDRVRSNEATVRITLDQAYAALATARPTPLRQHLEKLNLSAARLSTRVMAFHTALESSKADTRSAWITETLQPLLRSLSNSARSVAVTVVSRQPAHLAAFDVRLRRLENLLTVFRTQAPIGVSDPLIAAQVRELLHQMETELPQLRSALHATIDRAGERAAFSLELFDLQTWTLRPLATALNFNPRMDPALRRFTTRVTVMTMLGVAVFKIANWPHGYWLPLTMIIVMQPDYGSTRLRAAQRVLGTLAGSVAASLFLWWQLPFGVIAGACGVTVFGFGFFLKRNYAVAVFFITLVVVLLTEVHAPVTWLFTMERLGATFFGGALAWLASLFFWPVWERERWPAILAGALEANRDYLATLAKHSSEGSGYGADAIAAKRRTETASSVVFSSLQRMAADPRGRRDGLDQLAALANGNRRITAAMTVMALHLKAGEPMNAPGMAQFFEAASARFTALSRRVREQAPELTDLGWGSTLEELTRLQPEGQPTEKGERLHWVVSQMMRVATELAALEIAAKGSPVALATDPT